MTTKEYNQVVDLHADKLYRFGLKLAKNQDLAKDLVQESFARLWLKVEDVMFEKAKSYLFSTAYHYFIDHTRKEKRYSDEQEGDLSMAGESSDKSYSDISEVLDTALNQIPEIQKTVILLRDYEGYSYDEIGEICKLNPSQVKVYIYRARKALRAYLVSMENVI